MELDNLSLDSTDSEVILEEEEFEELDLPEEDLFHKNTASFRCLTQIEISRSSIFRDPYYYFPEIEDPHLEDALWAPEPSIVYDDIGIERYKDLCKKEEIIPFRRVINTLGSDVLDLKFYGLHAREMRTICETLENNYFITTLILQDNHLKPEDLKYLVKLIENNTSIKVLDLKQCQIGPLGAEVLGDVFFRNADIETLDLSFNSLEDEGIEFLAHGFRFNGAIKILNLSHNNLSDGALFALRPVLEDNYVIRQLDLSWNFFYKPLGMRELMEGLADNIGIEKLNLAWNGIGEKDTMKPIFFYLKSEGTKLLHLDLSNNRITGVPVRMLFAGLKVNESITTLNIAYNPITPEEVEFLAGVLLVSKENPSNLNTIDFGDTWVKKSFIQIRNRIRRKGFTVIFGGIYSNYKIKGPNIKELLLNRAKFVAMKPKKKKLRKNIGEWLLSIKEDVLTKEEFVDRIKKGKIKLDMDLNASIQAAFENKEKKISIQDMKEQYLKLYPDTKPPVKKKGGKKGKKKKK